MPTPETTRVKIHVSVAGHRPGELADVRSGYAEQLIRVGYATRVEDLDAALDAEPNRYGDFTPEDGDEDEKANDEADTTFFTPNADPADEEPTEANTAPDADEDSDTKDA